MPACRPTALPRASLVALALALAPALALTAPVPARAADDTPRALSARIEPLDTPPSLARGEVATAILDVRNTGTETWPAHGLVRLSYHWRHADGTPIPTDGRRTVLPAPVPPGGSIRLCALVEAPAVAGDLRLDWELVKEGHAWFAAADPGSLRRVPVVVRDAAAPRGPARVRPVVLWLAVTLAHLLVSVWWGSRRDVTGARPDLERAVFDTVIFALGTLHGVLFAVSATVGLDAISTPACLAAADAAIALALWWRGRADTALGLAPPPAASSDWINRALTAAGLVVLGGLAVSWVREAARTLHVSGSDAAHYHVPHAVNLALGASPFDLLPTPHLYPMGTSLIGAWAILPFGDPLLIDVAMLAFFLLLASALALAFRRATGLPGYAWIPWLLAAGLAAPLFRTASLFSSDLPLAAAAAAAGAALLDLRGQAGGGGRRAALRLAFAFGLLCGVKTTGAALTVLILGAAALVAFRRAWLARSAWRTLPALAPLAIVALTAWLAAGGGWLVRNHVRYGSPIAPTGLRVLGVTIFAGETLASGSQYLSIASDVARPGRYPLARRVVAWIRQWIGPVLWPLALLLVLLIVDMAGAWTSTDARGDPRLAIVVTVAVASAVLAWLLYQAPWTSLEWTKGLSLRYALPAIVGVGFVGFLGLFPRTLAWYGHPVALVAGWLAIGGGALWLLLRAQAALPAVSPDPLPRLDLASCAIAAAALAFAWLAARVGLARLAALAGLGALVYPLAVGLARHDASLVAAAQHEESRTVRCASAGIAEDLDPHVALYAGILADERRRGLACPRRRVLLDARFDLPLALQSLPYATTVLDARPVAADRAAVADAGSTPCDYVVITRAELDTERGARLLRRLQAHRTWTPVADGGRYAAFAVR